MQVHNEVDNANESASGLRSGRAPVGATLPQGDAVRLNHKRLWERAQLKKIPYPYQRRGIKWAIRREGETKEKRASLLSAGGILADDMGLGKTLQITESALIGDLMEDSDTPERLKGQGNNPVKTTLVVAPTSVVKQWRKEVLDYTTLRPEQVVVYHGTAESRRAITDEKLAADRVRMVITSYGMVQRSYSKLVRIGHPDPVPILHAHTWNRIILDEAHCIRNRSTVSHKACMSLRGTFRWCLTGTPITNDDRKDLAALAEFIGVAPYNSPQWWKSAPASDIVAWRKEFMLRRVMGKDVKLPPLTIETIRLPLTDREARFYKALEEETLVKFDEWCEATEDDEEEEGSSRREQVLLVWLHRLRQAASHPLLSMGGRIATSTLVGRVDKESKATKPKCARCHESSEDLSKRTGCGHLYCASCKKSSTCHVCQLMQDWKAKPESSRLAFVVDHLRTKRPKKSKSIVFSQWVAMLDLLHYLLKKTSGIRIFRIDGTVRDRGAVLEAFSAYDGEDKAVLLSSIQTSGTGLNITCADAVYLLDLWYQGVREDQAIARAHRIGQTKPVTAYRLVSTTKVDAILLDMMQQKRENAKATLESDAGPLKTKKADMSELVRIFTALATPTA